MKRVHIVVVMTKGLTDKVGFAPTRIALLLQYLLLNARVSSSAAVGGARFHFGKQIGNQRVTAFKFVARDWCRRGQWQLLLLLQNLLLLLENSRRRPSGGRSRAMGLQKSVTARSTWRRFGDH